MYFYTHLEHSFYCGSYLGAITLKYSGRRNYENFEDFSHEGPQDQNKHINSHWKDDHSLTQSHPSPMGATTENALKGTQVRHWDSFLSINSSDNY